MTNKRRSPIWKVSRNKFKEIVNNSNSVSEVLSYFGLKNIGGNYLTFWKRFKLDNLNEKKFRSKKNIKGSRHLRIKDIKKYLVKDSSISRGALKKHLIRNKLIDLSCAGEGCTVDQNWLGSKISLHLDHINGKSQDNRISNLRFLCPNCHSQTSTYSGKANKRLTPKPCKECNGKLSPSNKTGFCEPCYYKKLKTKEINLKRRIHTRPEMNLDKERKSHKYTQDFIKKIQKDKRAGLSYMAIAKKYKLPKSTVYYLIRNI